MAGRDDVFAKSLGSGRAALGAGPAPRIVDFSQALAQDAAAYDVSPLVNALEDYAADVKKKKDFDDVETGYDDFYEISSAAALEHEITEDPADYRRKMQAVAQMKASGMSSEAGRAFTARANQEIRTQYSGLLSAQDEHFTKRAIERFTRDASTIQRNLYELVRHSPDEDVALDDGYMASEVIGLQEDLRGLYESAAEKGFILSQGEVEDRISFTLASAGVHKYFDTAESLSEMRAIKSSFKTQDLRANPDYKNLVDNMPPDLRKKFFDSAIAYADHRIETINTEAGIAKIDLAMNFVRQSEIIENSLRDGNDQAALAAEEQLQESLKAVIKQYPDMDVSNIASNIYTLNVANSVQLNKFFEKAIDSQASLIGDLLLTVDKDSRASIQEEVNSISGNGEFTLKEKSTLLSNVLRRLGVTATGRANASREKLAAASTGNVLKDLQYAFDRINPLTEANTGRLLSLQRRYEVTVAQAKSEGWTSADLNRALGQIESEAKDLETDVNQDADRARQDLERTSFDAAQNLKAESINQQWDAFAKEHPELYGQSFTDSDHPVSEGLLRANQTTALGQHIAAATLLKHNKENGAEITDQHYVSLMGSYLNLAREEARKIKTREGKVRAEAADNHNAQLVDQRITKAVKGHPSDPVMRSFDVQRDHLIGKMITGEWAASKVKTGLNSIHQQMKDHLAETDKNRIKLEKLQGIYAGTLKTGTEADKLVSESLGLHDSAAALSFIQAIGSGGPITNDQVSVLRRLQGHLRKGYLADTVGNYFKTLFMSIAETNAQQNPQQIGDRFKMGMKAWKELTTDGSGVALESNLLQMLTDDQKARFFALESAIEQGGDSTQISSMAARMYENSSAAKPNTDLVTNAVGEVHSYLDPSSYGSMLFDTSFDDTHPIHAHATEYANRYNRQYPHLNAGQLAKMVAVRLQKEGWAISKTGVPQAMDGSIMDMSARYSRDALESFPKYNRHRDKLNSIMEDRLPRMLENIHPSIIGAAVEPDADFQMGAPFSSGIDAVSDLAGSLPIVRDYYDSSKSKFIWGKSLYLRAIRPAHAGSDPTHFDVLYYNGRVFLPLINKDGNAYTFNAEKAVKDIEEKNETESRLFNAEVIRTQAEAARAASR